MYNSIDINVTSKTKVYTYSSRYSLALGEINFLKYANKKVAWKRVNISG